MAKVNMEKVTVYTSGAHHRIQLTKQWNHLLAASALPDTVMILTKDDKQVPFTLTMPSTDLLDKVDGNITVMDSRGVETQGELVRMDPRHKYVSLLNSQGDVITIFQPTSISFHPEAPSLPYVKVKMDSYRAMVPTLSYMSTDLFWKPLMTAIIQDDKMSLFLSALITNLGQDRTIDLTLVSGKVNRSSYSPRVQYESKAMADLPLESSRPEMRIDKDRVTFEAGIVSLVYTHGTKNILPLHSDTSIKTQRVYVSNVDQDGPVEYGYSFTTPFSLPAGNVSVFTGAGADASVGPFLGNAYISGSNTGSQVNLMVGESSQVSCQYSVEKKVVGESIGDVHRYNKSIKTAVKNLTNNPISLVIRYYVGDHAIDHISCGHLLRDGNLEFHFDGVGTGSSTFACSFEETS